ncbi:hypothetical protein BU14_1367s0002 [Porphyra umbilicalis]|uniref:Plastid lipid-associated protein/fibrillin conserved domain-containing protein n=1 Tax=Porphyra umbilicalis TaxID=2786 RepID=A0A1X6NLX1_PORUM|nr:hypothetical protein BU14_1367s0002 [Porphyra umbilicalis]|eukprot:OSX69588.1 hypothetical protein BU14_1367s0002 [Porphyra umbilicalis]
MAFLPPVTAVPVGARSTTNATVRITPRRPASTDGAAVPQRRRASTSSPLPNGTPTMVFSSASPTTAVKAELMTAIASTRLGRSVASDRRAQEKIDAIVRRLEALNPTPVPVESAELGAVWKLVYTTSASILGTSRPPPLRPNDEIFQSVDVGAGTITNSEQLAGGLLTNKVHATFGVKPPMRVQVQFQRFQFGPLSVKAPASAKGFLDVTYLDDEVRVSRGNKDNLFVLLTPKGLANLV